MGFVGRLSSVKRVDLILASLSLLKRDSEFLALIAGDGPERNQLEKMAEELGIADSVKFLGETDNVDRILSKIDIFIFSSEGEAFSLVILEAMANRKPIVAFNVDGVNEAIVNNKTGFLVNNMDVQQFAYKIKYLIKNRNIAKTMGDEGFKRVKNNFSIKNCIYMYENMYEKLSDKKRLYLESTKTN